MKKIGLFDRLTGLVVLGIGLVLMALPDPTSLSDYLALVVILGGLNMLGANIDVGKLVGGK